jgi:hypothetical protein
LLSVQVEVRQAIRAAAVAELAWLDPTGRPQARPVTPLLLDDRPAVAYPYASADLARRVAAAPAVALVVSDDRLTGRGWRPVAVTGRPWLIEDRDGALFRDRLLEQELRKYPPARALADSPLLCREHWWYLPRLVVVVEDGVPATVGVRPDGAGEVLAVATSATRLVVETVRAAEDPPSGLRLTGLAGADQAGAGPTTADLAGPAVLLGHDFSVPDLERWTPWTTHGWLSGGALAVEQRPDRTTLEPPLGLWRRLARQRELSRACRRALSQPR